MLQPKQQIPKDRFIKGYMFLYLLMVAVISYTAFNCPFVGNNYFKFISINSLMLLFTSYYIIGWQTTKKWWDGYIKQAKYRAEFKRAVKEEVKKRMENV